MSDYRDKAAELRRQVVWASNEAIDPISQALLEAHNAGRAEAMEQGYALGFAASGEGWNGENPFAEEDPANDETWVKSRNWTINNAIRKGQAHGSKVPTR